MESIEKNFENVNWENILTSIKEDKFKKKYKNLYK